MKIAIIMSSPEIASSVRTKWLEYIVYSSSKLCQPSTAPLVVIFTLIFPYSSIAGPALPTLTPSAEQTMALTFATSKR